jgi:glycosyltransferase involved in cell wall biosynthesis
MKIVQMLPTISYGDAVGNDTLALHRALVNNGYKSEIYAENIDPRIKNKDIYRVDKYRDDDDTIILYHLSTGTELNEKLKAFKAKIIIIYHNITPPRFFKNYNSSSEKLCLEGIKGLESLKTLPIACFADSNHNASELLKAGYKCPIEVLPILMPFDDYKKKYNQEVYDKYNDEYVNILFTGRIAPNKKQEDIIASFDYYHRFINSKSRLFLVGNYNEADIYYRKLKQYVKELDVDNVYFSGHIKFDEILAYYAVSDVFLCLSEHEGFCVPIVESMLFGLPIIAYDSTAVGETMAGGGILLPEKTPQVVAEAIDILMNDKSIKNRIIHNQKVRLNDFDNEIIEKKFIELLKKYI